MNSFLRGLLLALQFFTRIPLPNFITRKLEFTPESMRCSLVHFPAIGWLVGALAALAFFFVLWLLGAPVMLHRAHTSLILLAVIFSTAITLWLTGAMHEDGLADVADALLGHHDAQKSLQIMKDSHVGVYAVLVLMLALVGKISLLVTLAVVRLEALLTVFLAAHVLSRMCALTLVGRLDHIGLSEKSKTQQVAGNISKLPLWQAVLWCLPLLGVYFQTQGLWLLVTIGVACVAMVTVVVLLGWWFQRRLGGFTGDCLGATQQICELVFYATTLIMLVRVVRY